VTFYAKKRRMPQVIIVSLIDIFAILLIFVIVTTTFKRAQPSVTIKLPESKTGVAAEKSEEPVVLSISENEEIFLDAKKVTLEELTDEVRKLVETKGTPTLAMSADKKTSYGFLIQVLDALKAAGIKGNLSALTEQKK
jgi:biopolymer transport protein ExbD